VTVTAKLLLLKVIGLVYSPRRQVTRPGQPTGARQWNVRSA
jgi:hypothetical protein